MPVKKYDVVVAGYLCIDLFPVFRGDNTVSSISNLLVPGRLIEIDGLNFVPGGVVANTGLALKKFNKKVFLNGLTGDDFIGKIARGWFADYDLSEGIKTVEKEGTALSIVLAPPGIDRIFLESPGCSRVFDNTYINWEAVSRSRIFHFGYPPLLKRYYIDGGSELRTLLSEINKMSVVTSLDFSLPDPETESGKVDWPEIMKSILPVTDIFVPSIEEALQAMLPAKYA
jgi:sugar/nucleoside kinase (ribokinase family)